MSECQSIIQIDSTQLRQWCEVDGFTDYDYTAYSLGFRRGIRWLQEQQAEQERATLWSFERIWQ